MSKKPIVIIPAAGRGTRMMGLTENNPKVMLPYEGKPIIGHNLDKLIENNIEEVIIVVGYKKEKIIDYVLKFYGKKLNIRFIEQTELNGLAGALEKATSIIEEDSEILIVLGDIILKSNTIFNDEGSKDTVWYNHKEDYARWCFVSLELPANKIVFYDKPSTPPPTKQALVGVYKLSSSKTFRKHLLKVLLNEKNKVNGEFQISTALKTYDSEKIINIRPINSDEYFDMGEVEDLIETRKNITRFFNKITKTSHGTIIKTSTNPRKMADELQWYVNLPQKMKMFTPHIFDSYSNGYEIEFINSSPIQELYIYDLMDLSDWRKLFNRVNFFIEQMTTMSETMDVLLKSTNEMYRVKTKNRIEEFESSNTYKDFNFDKKFITINNIVYKNPFAHKDEINKLINRISVIRGEEIGYIHGDLFFGNMFYDIPTGQLKVIDPRGKFGESPVGDIRYDIAKLNHSINGNYDFIVNGLYTLDYTDGSFNYSFYEGKQNNVKEIFDELVLSKYNKEEIEILTGLLFLTMLPLHEDNQKNQIMQVIMATKFLNKFI